MTEELTVYEKTNPPEIENMMPGTFVVLRQGIVGIITLMHYKGKPRRFIISQRGFIYNMSNYNKELKHKSGVNSLDIVQVYGLQKYNENLYDQNFTEMFSTIRRKLIWADEMV